MQRLQQRCEYVTLIAVHSDADSDADSSAPSAAPSLSSDSEEERRYNAMPPLLDTDDAERMQRLRQQEAAQRKAKAKVNQRNAAAAAAGRRDAEAAAPAAADLADFIVADGPESAW